MEFLATRRRALRTLGSLPLTLGLGAGATGAAAQGAYPAKPVLIINNFPPGGPSDLLGRSIAPALHETLKQPFIVENRAGAAGNIGADAVAKSQPDGHTLLVGIDTTFTVNPYIYRSMSFKATDLVPVVIMASSGLLVGVHPSTGIKTLEKLIAAGKTRAIALSSAGNGSPGHLAAQVLSDATGMRINPIFYRGNTPAVTAVVQVLQKSILDALKRPEVQTRMSSLDLRFEGLTGAAAHERMAALSARYARVVQATDMKVE